MSKMLSNVIAEIMLTKKAKDVITINLKNIEGTVCDYFVVCHGHSHTQILTIRDAVVDEVRKMVGEKPWHIEGADSSEWLLIDYQNVIVHIFMEEARKYYDIESLWADGEFMKFEDNTITNS